MPYSTTARGLLRNFWCGVQPLATNQRESTSPVQSPTSFPLLEILAAGDGGRVTWSGASDRRIPRDGEGGRRWSRGE